MIRLNDHQEDAQSVDPFLDFCLWEYECQSEPNGKLRSINMLLHSFEYTGVDDAMLELCNAIRDGLGDWRTVWGIKQVDSKLSWEFYFYDYSRLNRASSVTRLLEIIEPYVKCDLEFNEDVLYFMFSIDLDEELLAGRGNLDDINIYIGNIGNFGNMISSGIAYKYSKRGMVLDNLYYFFDAGSGLQDIADKVVSSVHVKPGEINLDEVLIPELRDCKTIVVANKKHNDGIYFSGISIDQLLSFMKVMTYPAELISYISNNKRSFNHLLYDVGIDYRMRNGKLELLKSSYYGVF
jgi:hypothetical protein